MGEIIYTKETEKKYQGKKVFLITKNPDKTGWNRNLWHYAIKTNGIWELVPTLGFEMKAWK